MLKRIGVILALLLGILILLKKDDILDYWYQLTHKDNRPPIAVLDKTEGKVLYKLPETLVYKKAKEHLDLRSLDTITTDVDGTATIKFLAGLELEVQPNSMLVIEEPSTNSNGVIQITFLRGQYRVVNVTSGSKFSISKDNIVQDPAGRPAPQPLKIALKPMPTPGPTPAPTPIILATPKPVLVSQEKVEDLKKKDRAREVVKQDQEILPDDYIINVIKNQKPYFQRCYIQHLRLNPNAQGRINLSIIVDPDGRVSSVRILKSTVSDPKLEQCVMTVIERTKFRSYKGSPTRINYPIDFS